MIPPRHATRPNACPVHIHSVRMNRMVAHIEWLIAYHLPWWQNHAGRADMEDQDGRQRKTTDALFPKSAYQNFAHVDTSKRMMPMHDMQTHLQRVISKHRAPILIVSLLALALGMQGGTPFHHPDSLIGRAKYTVRNFGNPDFFNYPGLMLYLNGVVYSFYELLLQALPHGLRGILDAWPYSDNPGHQGNGGCAPVTWA